MFKALISKDVKSTVVKLATIALPLAFAATAQASELLLATGFVSTQASGEIVGTFGLANIASRDRSGEFCLGYADRNPDHVFTLEQDFAQLTIAVDSGGADTTLLIQGPNNSTVRCNDNASRRSRDAQIQDSFTEGTYKLWVGSFDQEGRHRYNLTISE